MKPFFDFILENRKEIICFLTLIVGVISIFIKRKPKTIDDFTLALSEVINLVPELIIKFEEPSHGTEKKEKVISSALRLVKLSLGRSLTNSEKSIITSKVSEKIETILATPKKKVSC